MSAVPNRPSDLEANHNDYRTSEDTPTNNQTYQSTILPASATDFDPEPHKRLFRQFANPAPLGLCGFALTTFVLSLINVHARSVTQPNIVIGLGMPQIKAFIDFSPCVRWICSVLCGNVGVRGVVILSVLLHSVPTVHSGSVSLVSSFHSSTFQQLKPTHPILLNSPTHLVTISSVFTISYGVLTCRLVNFHMVFVCRHAPLVNRLLRSIFHSCNGILNACNWLLSRRKYQLD